MSLSCLGYQSLLGDVTNQPDPRWSLARAMLGVGRTGTVVAGGDGAHCPKPVNLLVESSAPPPRLLVFGAIDFAAALVRLGKFLGYHLTVCDARPVFATRARFGGIPPVPAWPELG